MRSFSALKTSSLQQLLSLALGYPALLIYLGIALSDALNHRPWTWTVLLLTAYLLAILRIGNKPLSNS